MKVTLIKCPSELEALETMYTAAQTCYSADVPSVIYEKSKTRSKQTMIDLITKVLNSKHYSICEHVDVTLSVEGISRACSHQFVRHRLCTYSQQSQRYVNFSDKSFDFITPPKIAANDGLKTEYEAMMADLKRLYDRMCKYDIPAEDARYLLPNAAATNITFTTNLRNLIHICELRLCSRAQWEVRAVYRDIAAEVIKALPIMKDYLVPQCERQGYCTELKCCGRKKRFEDTFKVLEDDNE